MDEQRDLVVVGTKDGSGFLGDAADWRQPGEQRTEYGTETLFDTETVRASVASSSASRSGKNPLPRGVDKSKASNFIQKRIRR